MSIPLLSYSFRPFFLLTAGYAVLAIGVWALHQQGVLDWPSTLPAHVLHGHEMLFGYAGGAIAGFALTAVATWTSRPAVAGFPLVALCGVWLAARIGAFMPGETGVVVWGLSSLAFWSALTLLMAREVWCARNSRNYKILPLLFAFVGTETVFFTSPADYLPRLETCLRAGVFLVVGMISLIGGRIIPNFTQNWLKFHRPELDVRLPSFDIYDLAGNLVTAAFALGFIIAPMIVLTGWLGVTAALVQIGRLARWRGWLARKEPLLWILHVGYGWLPVGFGLLGLSGLGWPGLFDAGIHGLTYGAIGTLILGVAARVALGHTGRPLKAFPAMTVAFCLINLGVVLRLMGSVDAVFIAPSVLLWMVSYLVFLIQYTPILVSSRADSNRGR